jgi:hypothetical protein
MCPAAPSSVCPAPCDPHRMTAEIEAEVDCEPHRPQVGPLCLRCSRHCPRTTEEPQNTEALLAPSTTWELLGWLCGARLLHLQLAARVGCWVARLWGPLCSRPDAAIEDEAKKDPLTLCEAVFQPKSQKARPILIAAAAQLALARATCTG